MRTFVPLVLLSYRQELEKAFTPPWPNEAGNAST
jgi:hypothetical protein